MQMCTFFTLTRACRIRLNFSESGIFLNRYDTRYPTKRENGYNAFIDVYWTKFVEHLKSNDNQLQLFPAIWSSTNPDYQFRLNSIISSIPDLENEPKNIKLLFNTK